MFPAEQMAPRIARIFGENSDLALEFYCLASEIVDDFEDYGPMLQADENGEYSDATVIRKLQVARNQLIKRLRLL